MKTIQKLTKAQQIAAQAEWLAEEKRARCAVVDELGQLDADIATSDALMAPKIEKAKMLRLEVDVWLGGSTPEQSSVFSGERFSAMCGPRKNERALDHAAFRKLVGDSYYFDVATVALGKADECAKTLAGVAQCITSAKTGKRTIITFGKAS